MGNTMPIVMNGAALELAVQAMFSTMGHVSSRIIPVLIIQNYSRTEFYSLSMVITSVI